MEVILHFPLFLKEAGVREPKERAHSMDAEVGGESKGQHRATEVQKAGVGKDEGERHPSPHLDNYVLGAGEEKPLPSNTSLLVTYNHWCEADSGASPVGI